MPTTTDRDARPATDKQKEYIRGLMERRLVPLRLRLEVDGIEENLLTYGDYRRLIQRLEQCRLRPGPVTMPAPWVLTRVDTNPGRARSEAVIHACPSTDWDEM